MTRGATALAVGLAAVVGAAEIFWVARSDQVPDPALTATLYVSVALAFVVTGAIAALRRPGNRTGTLMVAVGYAWFLGGLVAAENPFLFTVGALVSTIPYALVAALALAYPTGELRERIDRALVGAAVALVTVGQVAFLLVADSDLLCAREVACPDNLLQVTESDAIGLAVRWTLNAAVLATVTATVARLWARWHRGSPALRRVLGPVYVAAALSFVLVVVRIVAADVTGSTDTALWIAQIATLLGVPVAFLLGLLRSRLAQGSVTGLMRAIGRGTPLRDALASALGDPTLTIGYWLDSDSRYVDDRGRPFAADELPPGRAATVIEHEGTRVAVLVHDASLKEEPELLDALAGTAALALQNAGLQAEARAQYAFLETLVESSPSLFVHIDTEGRITKQNGFAVEVAGYDDEEQIRGRLFWDVFISPEERPDVVRRFEEMRPTFPLGEYENTFVNARGERRVVFWRAAPVRVDGGEVAGIIAAGVDITARREEQRAREREREFLLTIANEAPSLLCLIDENGLLSPNATNLAFERTLEYEPHDTGGHVLWERYIAPEDAADAERRVRDVAAGRPVSATDSTWVTSTGRRLTVSWSCTPLPPVDDRRLLLVSGVDVTERRQRELEVQRERDATTTVLETIPSVIAVLGRDFVIRDRDVDNPRAGVNRAFRETLRWRDVELVGRSFLDLVAEDDDGRARAALARAAAGAPSQPVESDWLTRDGERVTVEWSAAPVTDVTGRTDGLVLVSGVDVTQRRATEREASLRQAFMNAVAESVPNFLVVVDDEAVVRPEGVNRAFTETFGWGPADLEGTGFLGSVLAETDHPARIAIANAANGVVQGELESTWRCSDGSERFVAWSARPVVDVEGQSAVLVSGTDVTQRRAQAEELRASRARIVAAGDEARRRLERNLHDGAQQRLVALSVSLRLAMAKLHADPDATASILEASQHELAQALEELRELARGIHPAVLTDRGLGPALEALAARSTMPVELELPSQRLPGPVEAAAYYVVLEALTNVVKYAGATGARVSVAVEDGCVGIRVADDGRGGADPSAGTGLRGLADRVAALDGTLAVESPAGAGTTVVATIPLPSVAAETAETRPVAP